MIWGLVVAASLGVVTAAVAAAQDPNPEPLWNAYPLDDGAGTTTAAQSATTTTPAEPSRTTAAAPLRSVEEAGDDPPWLLMVAAAAGGAAFVVLLLMLQGRRARKREADLVPVGSRDEWQWLKRGPANGTADVRVERLHKPENGTAPPRPEPTFEVVEEAGVPRHWFERQPEVSNGRAAAASRRGPICQVRWSRDDGCFYAATTDEHGGEQRLAQSPPFEWLGDEQPDEESREARTALRVLSKELRDNGWRPMRVKGADFDEQRWYARRFRLPVAEPLPKM